MDRSGRSNILELTRQGWRSWKKAVGRQRPKCEDQDLESGGEVSLHNFSVRFHLKNAAGLEDGWRERWAVGKTRRSTYDPTNDSHVYWKENWRFRITGEHVIVKLEDGIRGENPVNLKDRALVEALDARDWLEKNSPARIASEPSDFRIWVNRQHLAIVQDPFCQLVDQFSEVDISDVKFYDEDGTERLWLDNSEGERHLEAGNAPGENRILAEDDVEHIKSELYEWMIDNKSAWGEIQALGEALADEENGLSVESLRDGDGGPESRTLSDEFTITSRWIHRYGHVMGWAEELGRPITLIREESLPGSSRS